MIRNLIIAVCALLFVSSCSKDERDKLYGKWQMQEIDTNGTVEKVDTIYYNFQHGLFQYQIHNENTGIGRTSDGFNEVIGENQIELEILNEGLLPYTDWTATKRVFTIDEVTSKRLVLTSGDKTYTFRNF